MTRTSPDQKREARRRLLESAARVFARSGFEAARVDAISTGAGFAKGTVYNHFASKEALFGAVVEEAARLAVARYRAALAEGAGRTSTRARLRALVEADISVLREQEDFVKVLVREALAFHPDRSALVTEHLAPFLGAVADILAEGAARGEVRADRPPAQLALLFVGMLGLLYGQRWASGWPSLDELPDLLLDCFLDGAAPREGGP